jgi:hypothetical protein
MLEGREKTVLMASGLCQNLRTNLLALHKGIMVGFGGTLESCHGHPRLLLTVKS